MTPKEVKNFMYDDHGKCKVYTNEWLTLINTPKQIVQATINQKFFVHVRIATKVNLVHYDTGKKTFSHYEWQEYRDSKGKWKECSSYGFYNNLEEMRQEIIKEVKPCQLKL